MKTLFLVFALMLSPGAHAQYPENPDQQASDLAMEAFVSFDSHADLGDLGHIPRRFQCGDREIILDQIFDQDSHLSDFEQLVVITSSLDHESLVFNFSDGDQVEMYKIKKSDLAQLKTEQTQEIPAVTVKGFWWADGDHYLAGNVACTR